MRAVKYRFEIVPCHVATAFRTDREESHTTREGESWSFCALPNSLLTMRKPRFFGRKRMTRGTFASEPLFFVQNSYIFLKIYEKILRQILKKWRESLEIFNVFVYNNQA